MTSNLIELGVMGKVHGIKGDIFVNLYNEDSDCIEFLQTVYIGTADPKKYTISSWKKHKGKYLICLDELKQREALQNITLAKIYCKREDLPDNQSSDDSVYVDDLLGMQVLNEAGDKLGVLVGTVFSPAHEILRIKHGQQEWLCPFHEEYIVDVNIDEKTIVVQNVQELIDLNETDE